MLLCTCVLPKGEIHAQERNIYPLMYEATLQGQSGRLIPTPTDSGAGLLLYFLLKQKSYWNENAQVVEVWQGLAPSNARGGGLAGTDVLGAQAISPISLLAVVQDSEGTRLAEIDSTPRIVREELLAVNTEALSAEEVRIAVNTREGTAMVLLGTELYHCNYQGPRLLVAQTAAPEVTDVIYVAEDRQGAGHFAYLRRDGLRYRVVFMQADGREYFIREVQIKEEAHLYPIAPGMVAVLSDIGDLTNAAFVGADSSFRTATIYGRHHTILLHDRGTGAFRARYIGYSDRIQWQWMDIPRTSGNITSGVYTEFPPGFNSPLGVVSSGRGNNDTSYVLFRNGIVGLDESGSILAAEFFEFNFDGSLPLNLECSDDSTLIASQALSTWVLQRQDNSFWLLNRLILDLWVYLTVVLLCIALLFVSRKYLDKRRILHTLFEMPEADPFIVVDKEGRLTSLNDSARSLLQLPQTVPLRRVFQFYCTGLKADELLRLVEEALLYRRTLNRRISFERPEGALEYLFSAIPIPGLISSRSGLLLIGRDITEELEKKRLNNWAQLAHDMKTNLSIIKLNAQKVMELENAAQDGLGKKILFQVNLLINRVRDLVTIGSNDKLDLSTVDAMSLCEEVREEFDTSLFPNATLTLDTRPVLIRCDRLKLVRALRNAVENSIRSLHGKAGTVEIASWFDRDYVYLQVRDTGVGMDSETLNNMRKPFFTKYKQQGGTGMGTMIMQHVMELHGGDMRVESEKGRGTTVLFRLPNILTRMPGRLPARPESESKRESHADTV